MVTCASADVKHWLACACTHHAGNIRQRCVGPFDFLFCLSCTVPTHEHATTLPSELLCPKSTHTHAHPRCVHTCQRKATHISTLNPHTSASALPPSPTLFTHPQITTQSRAALQAVPPSFWARTPTAPASQKWACPGRLWASARRTPPSQRCVLLTKPLLNPVRCNVARNRMPC